MKSFSIKNIPLLSQILIFLGLFLVQIIPLYWGLSFPIEFWIKQALMYLVYIGVFYINYSFTLPKWLLQGKNALFLLSIIIILVSVNYLSSGITKLLDLDNVIRIYFKLPQDIQKHNEGHLIGAFAEIIITLLIIGASTVISIAKKLQTEHQMRQELESEKVVSELSFLKSQINPHFFFNILNSIYALAGNENQPAREAIYTLSHMMRYVLYDTKNNLTTLSREIAFVEDYLELMELRITDKVQVIFEKPATINDVEVAPMLFLPFIENAYKHGISSIYPSYIFIEIKQSANLLEIEIRNSIFENQTINKEESNGIGLANTRRRLDLIYPGKYELDTIADESQKEYQVKLKLQTP